MSSERDGAYRLAPVRDARARDERVRRGELAGAVGDALAAEARVAAEAARVEAARAAVATAEAGRAALATGTAAALGAAEAFAARRRHELVGAQLAHARAVAAQQQRQGVIDDARTRLAIARGARQVIERHFAAWREAAHKARERRED